MEMIALVSKCNSFISDYRSSKVHKYMCVSLQTLSLFFLLLLYLKKVSLIKSNVYSIHYKILSFVCDVLSLQIFSHG